MGNYVSDQFLIFLRAVALGASAALVYDIFGALRKLGGRLWGGVLDVLFCVAAAGGVFVFVMTGDGELRVFMVLGIVGGAVLFWCLLAGLLRPVWAFWLELALLPARWAEKILKKCCRAGKKVCTFWKNWFTMKVNTLRCKKPPERQGGDEEMAAPSKGKAARAPQKKAKTAKTAGGKLTVFILVLLLLGIGVQIFRMFDQLQAARETESVYAQQLAELKETNQQLQDDLDKSGSMDMIEDIARDQLGMIHEGDKVFHFSK